MFNRLIALFKRVQERCRKDEMYGRFATIGHCLRASNAQMALIFGVSVATIRRWKTKTEIDKEAEERCVTIYNLVRDYDLSHYSLTQTVNNKSLLDLLSSPKLDQIEIKLQLFLHQLGAE